MEIQKTTFFRGRALLCLFLTLWVNAFAQTTPTFTSYNPTKVTQRSSVILNGTNFTGITAVRFNTIAATSFTINTAGTQITAILPEVTGIAAGATATLSVSVIKSSVTTTAPTTITLSYVAPAATPGNAGITRVITNFGGYWSSSAASSVPASQPDTGHSLLAFRYNNILYSTGAEHATTLGGNNAATTGTFTTSNFRALPINNIAGTVPNNPIGSNPNLIVLGSKIDGSSTTQVPTAPSVTGLSVRDVLIDGLRGLNLGTGVTNLPSTSVLTFQASGIVTGVVTDDIPDILVSQVATPSANSYSIYCFLDASGNIVGTPVQINLSGVTPVGTYKTDFFSLPAGASLNTATINGTANPGGTTRDIRLVAYRLTDFGITENNRTQAVQFKVMPSGTSDPALWHITATRLPYLRPKLHLQASRYLRQYAGWVGTV